MLRQLENCLKKLGAISVFCLWKRDCILSNYALEKTFDIKKKSAYCASHKRKLVPNTVNFNCFQCVALLKTFSCRNFSVNVPTKSTQLIEIPVVT